MSSAPPPAYAPAADAPSNNPPVAVAPAPAATAAPDAPRRAPPSRLSLYVHIPFCETKCPYCDFNTYAAIEPLMPAYSNALRREIALWGSLLNAPSVHTVFFGGGTPSYLPAEDIRRAMDTISSAFRLDPDAETTLEANPGDFTPAKLAAYLECGVNRLSIGVQSFDDDLLRALGRRHTAADARRAYRMAADAGFDSISLDLMYGLPHQTAAQWRSTLDAALELAPPHISMYCLTLEGGTPMERGVARGCIPEPDPDAAADMHIAAQDAMRQAGYRHYEISNWALPGKRSRHNLTYWRNQPYLGVGPGAHSYLADFRFSAVRSPREYAQRMQALDLNAQDNPRANAADAGTLDNAIPDAGIPPTTLAPDAPIRDRIAAVPVVAETERIDARLEMAETMMLGLRLDCGVSIDEFAARFGNPPERYYAAEIDDLQRLGLLTARDGALRLTHRGMMMANEAVSRFF